MLARHIKRQLDTRLAELAQRDTFTLGLFSRDGWRNRFCVAEHPAEADDAPALLQTLVTAELERLPCFAVQPVAQQATIRQAIEQVLYLRDYIRHLNARNIDHPLTELARHFNELPGGVQVMFIRDLSNLMPEAGDPEHNAELETFIAHWRPLIAQDWGALIHYTKTAPDLKSALQRLRVLCFKLSASWTGTAAAMPGLRGYLDGFDVHDVIEISETIETILDIVYEEHGDLRFAEVFARADQLLSNTVFLTISPTLLQQLIQRLHTMSLTYRDIENALNKKDYPTALHHTRTLLQLRAFRELIPPRFALYLDAIQDLYDALEYALDNDGEFSILQEAVSEFFHSPALGELYERYLRPSEGYSAADFRANVSKTAEAFVRLHQAASLDNALFHLAKIARLLNANPHLAATASAQGTLRDIDSLLKIAHKLKLALEAGHVSQAITLIESMRALERFQSLWPPALQEIQDSLRTLQDQIKALEIALRDLQREPIAKGATDKVIRAFLTLSQQPSARNYLPPAVLTLVDALKDVHELLSAQHKPEALDAWVHFIFGFDNLTACFDAYLATPLQQNAAELKASLLRQHANLVTVQQATNLTEFLGALQAFRVSLAEETLLKEMPSVQKQLTELDALLTPLSDVPSLLANGEYTAIIARIRAISALPAGMTLFPAVIKQLLADLLPIEQELTTLETAIRDNATSGTPDSGMALFQAIRPILQSKAGKSYLPESARLPIEAIYECLDIVEKSGEANVSAEGWLQFVFDRKAIQALYRLQVEKPMKMSHEYLKKLFLQSLQSYQKFQAADSLEGFVLHGKAFLQNLRDNPFINLSEGIESRLADLQDTLNRVDRLRELSEQGDFLAVIDTLDALTSNKTLDQILPKALTSLFSDLKVLRPKLYLLRRALTQNLDSAQGEDGLAVFRAICALLENPTLTRYLPESVRLYIALIKESYDLLEKLGEPTVSLPDWVNLVLGKPAIEKLFNAQVAAHFKTSHAEFAENIRGLTRDFITLRRVTSLPGAITALTAITRCLKSNPITESLQTSQVFLDDTEKALQYCLSLHEAINLGNYASALKIAKQIRDLKSVADFLPEYLQQTLDQLMTLEPRFVRLQSAIDIAEHPTAINETRDILEESAFQSLFPHHSRDYLQLTVDCYDQFQLMMHHDPSEGTGAPIQTLLASEALKAIYERRLNQRGTMPYHRFQTNLGDALELAHTMMHEQSVSGFLQAVTAFQAVLKKNPILLKSPKIQALLTDVQAIAEGAKNSLLDINAGRYAEAMDHFLKISEIPLISTALPQFIHAQLSHLQGIRRGLSTIESLIDERLYEQALLQMGNLTQSDAFKSLLPEHLHAYADLYFQGMQAFYNDVSPCLQKNAFMEAHANIQTFLNSDLPKKVFGDILGKEDFSRFLQDFRTASTALSELLRVLYLEGESTEASSLRIQGIINWIHEHRSDLGSLRQYEAFRPYADSPLIQFVDRISNLFARRGFPAQAPNLDNLSLRENFWLSYYLEEYFRKNAEASAKEQGPTPFGYRFRVIWNVTVFTVSYLLNYTWSQVRNTTNKIGSWFGCSSSRRNRTLEATDPVNPRGPTKNGLALNESPNERRFHPNYDRDRSESTPAMQRTSPTFEAMIKVKQAKRLSSI